MPEPQEPVPEQPRPARTALRALRTHLGWVCCAGGVLLCALGWYGVSGERYTARQIPFLASATAPGAALIIGGTVLLAARRRDVPVSARVSAEQQHDLDRMQRQLEVLYQLLTDAVGSAEPPSGATSDHQAGSGPNGSALLLAVPGGRTYHRTGCLLVQGRQDPERLLDGAASERGLRPCPLCDPPEV
ncbi:hypothetical protein [Streptacidiphilus carbonis]|jgi:hypothetical protein|uniref:hypothetical protein n=1 Tax=Streptacidiphilus carbonis TaxID=105422 RepID=UPI001F25D99B|nr:hypothetical protein [Streptacidiphilus carbonis]